MSVLVPLAVAAALSVGVDENPGARVPAELRFVDAQGARVTLGDALGGDAPAVLVLAYARCTLLCNVVLANLASAVRGLDRERGREPGRDVRLVIVDLDERVRPAEAAKKQATLLAEAGLPGEPARWPYLAGEGDSVARLAAVLGFRFAWDPRTQQYVHPAVVFVLTPDRRISRYLYGIELAPATL
ncbi:MAG: SCO family protein, partial [Deltaproteobacteria bacterium]|nr:SCO family protein [Kofleriaceae bacterium]